MEINHHIWREWAQKLQHWGVNDVVASFLEASGPFSMVVANLIYFLQPALNWLAPEDQLSQFAEMLDDQTQKHSFITYLREEKSP